MPMQGRVGQGSGERGIRGVRSGQFRARRSNVGQCGTGQGSVGSVGMAWHGMAVRGGQSGM